MSRSRRPRRVAERPRAGVCRRLLVPLRARGREKPARATLLVARMRAGMFFATGARAGETNNRRPPRPGGGPPLGRGTWTPRPRTTPTRTALELDLNPADWPRGQGHTRARRVAFLFGAKVSAEPRSELSPGTVPSMVIELSPGIARRRDARAAVRSAAWCVVMVVVVPFPQGAPPLPPGAGAGWSQPNAPPRAKNKTARQPAPRNPPPAGV